MGKKRIRFGSRDKKTEDFVDPDKDPYSYLKRYILEENYRDWFERNYPDNTIYGAVGLNEWDYNEMKKNLKESEIYLNSSPAFAERCKHWNQINILASITPVRNLKNPFLRLKREIEDALNNSVDSYLVRNVSKSLMWFYAAPYSDDWVT